MTQSVTVETSPVLYYSIFDGTLNLYPIPDDVYQLANMYYRYPATLSADTDVPDIDSEFHEYLIDYVIWKLLESVEGKEEIARRYEFNYKRGVQIAIGKVTSKTGIGTSIVKPQNMTY